MRSAQEGAADTAYEAPIRGRLAPSPSGRMHAGNIYAALMSWLIAKSQGGSVVLRIDDLDEGRSKPAFAEGVIVDFENLGLTWDEGPFYQQGRKERYQEALATLQSQGLIYPCFCTRADIRAASAPHMGEKPVYPGTCRNLSQEERILKERLRPGALRLKVPCETVGFTDLIQGEFHQDLAADCGDFLVKRSDGLFAYQLACVVDDGDEGITSVVRGVDLITSTPQQIYLAHLLGFETPTYAHVPLFVSTSGRRLSKRDRDASLEELLIAYGSPKAVLGHIAFTAGLIPEDEPITPEELLASFDSDALAELFPDKIAIPWS